LYGIIRRGKEGKKVPFTQKEFHDDNPKVLRKSILTLGISF
jgi:hypothetical protein